MKPANLQIAQKAIEDLRQSLLPLHGERESNNIVRILLEDCFGIKQITRSWELFDLNRLQHIKERLQQNEPIQYITEIAYFYGYPFYVNDTVLIPRPETEELVYQILQKTKSYPKGKVLDIGTGSGCIPISIKKRQTELDCTGIDISEKALKVAIKNAEALEVAVDFKLFDILDKSVWAELGKYDVVISNPPYIPPSEAHLMPEQVKQYEPHLALFVEEEDALIFYKKIIQFALLQLKKGGWLFFEGNEYNARAVVSLLAPLAFQNIELLQDLQGKDRMICAQKC